MTGADESVPEGGEGNGHGQLGSREVGGGGSGVSVAGLAADKTSDNTDLSDSVAVHAHQSTWSCVTPLTDSPATERYGQTTSLGVDLSDSVAVHAHQSTGRVPKVADERDLIDALAPAGAWLAAAREASASSVCEKRCAWHGC